MKLLARIFALFLIMPIIELALLVQMDKLVGFWPTIGLIVFTGLLGGYLAKREGLSVWTRFNDRLNAGGLPGKELVDGVIILIAGALLITPGVLTDLFGFLGLLPPSRAFFRKIAMKRIQRAMDRGAISVIGFDGWTNNGFEAGPYADSERAEDRSPRWQGEASERPRHTRDSVEQETRNARSDQN